MMNKNWAFALGMLSLSTAMIAADQTSDMNQKQTPMPMGVTSQPTGVITPPVAPCVNNGADIFVSADFIYWNTKQDGLAYAWSGDVGNVDNPDPSHSKINYADSQWEPGFKLGAGLEFEHDGWDLFAQWTWLNPVTDNKSSVKLDEDSSLYDAIVPYVNASNPPNTQYNTGSFKGDENSVSLSKAEASWSLHYNIIDLELGRNFFLSRYLTLRPHIGLKSAWINQNFNKKYSVASPLQYGLGNEWGPFSLMEIGPNGAITMRQSQESWGLGMRVGIDPVFHICRNWGVYGNLALSAMYQHYTTTLKIKVNNPDTEYDSFVQNNTKTSFHNIIPVLEFGLGLEYMAWFYDEAYMLELKAGWEEQVWINTNQFQDSSSQGNLNLQGFTFKAGFHF